MATPFRKKIEIIFFSNKRKIQLDLPTVILIVGLQPTDGYITVAVTGPLPLAASSSGTTYYNVSIVTPTLRMDHILHNRPTINMKAIQCSTTQYSVRLLYILFCHWLPVAVPPPGTGIITFLVAGHVGRVRVDTKKVVFFTKWIRNRKS